jgi:hypothetical protein
VDKAQVRKNCIRSFGLTPAFARPNETPRDKLPADFLLEGERLLLAEQEIPKEERELVHALALHLSLTMKKDANKRGAARARARSIGNAAR